MTAATTMRARSVRVSDGRIHIWILAAMAFLAAVTLEPAIFVGGVCGSGIVMLLRKRDRPPILMFCLGYQLLFCVAGVVYRGFFGVYPTDHQAPLVGLTSSLLSGSLLCLTFGIVVGMGLVESHRGWRRRAAALPNVEYSIAPLFWLTVGTFAISWFVTVNPRQISQLMSQLIYRVLEFRFLFLFLLFTAVVRQRRGYGPATIAGAFVSLPLLVSGGSGFARSILIVFIVLLNESQLMSSFKLARKYPGRVLGLGASALLLMVIAVLWNGGMKGHWRQKLAAGEVEGSVISQLNLFFRESTSTIGDMDPERGLFTTAKRISDVPVMMNFVYQRIPERMPFTGGEQVMAAIQHVTMPRFLFPNKTNLGSDSRLVRRYTGLEVAGAAQGASIGMGYLIEFYVDFGYFGLVFGAFLMGALIGVCCRLLVVAAPSRPLYFGTLLAILMQHFMSLDGSLAKLLGGLIMAFVVQGCFLMVFGRNLHRLLKPMRIPG